MRRAVHAEWTKLRTVPGNVWLAGGVVALMIALAIAILSALNTSVCAPAEGCREDVTKLSLSGVWLGQTAVVMLAVLTVTSEYGTGLIRTTLMADPRRGRVLAAKAAIVTLIVLAVAALGVAGSLLTGRILLPGHGFTEANGYPPLSIGDGPTLRAAVGTVLYLGLVALFSVGVGTAVRDTTGALTTVLSLLYLFPLIAGIVSDPVWHERLQKYAPMTAGLTVQVTRDLDEQPIGPWAGLGVMAGYAAAAMVLGAVLFKVRDA